MEAPTAPEMIANRYRVIETLGEGAMGLVYRAHDTVAAAEVALKVISKKVGSSAKTVLQFKQEFRLMTQLRHPNCCAVYEYGQTADGEPFFTMEVVDGLGVDEAMPLAEPAFRDVLGQLLMALGYVHQLGFLHRDIKAANVRIRPDGVVKLMDYGLMEHAGRAGGPISGTVAYLAPEVIRRGPVDQRADLYAVGVLAYEMLTGVQPFRGDKAIEVVRAHVHDRPVPPSALVPGLSPAIERVVLKLLAKEPLERYQSANEVLADLGFETSLGVGGNLLSSPLIGRGAEQGVLREHLARVADGGAGAALLLVGQPGMGKSRLVEDFRFNAQLAALPCALGACHEQGQAPYGPFVAALKALVPSMRAHAPELLERHAGVLVKLLPELEADPAPDLDPPSREKARLQATIAECLAGLASVRPFLLVIEDWQWADPLSQELARALRRTLEGAPALLLLTARPGPEADALAAAGWMTLPLAGLDVADTRRMVTAILGTSALDEALLQQVARFTTGVPFLVEELLSHWVQETILINENGRWKTDITATPDLLPTSLKSLLLRKIHYLSDTAQAVARAAAVAGDATGLDRLKRATGLADEALFAAIEMLLAQQVLEQAESGGYRFAQDQLKELVYGRLDPDEKRQLHTALGLAIEHELLAAIGGRPLASAPRETLVAMAHHFVAGALPDKTIRYALEAGMQSARLHANTDAERLLEAGLALVRASAATGELLDYLRTLGDVWRMMGKSDQALECYLEAMPLAEASGDQALIGQMAISLGKIHQMLSRLPEALEWTRRGFEACEAGFDASGQARALLTSCRLEFMRGDIPAARRDVEAGLAIARAAHDPNRVAEALGFLGYLYVASSPEKLQEGVRFLHESVAQNQAIGDRIGLANAYDLLGNALNALGDYAEARDAFSQHRRICRELGMHDDMVFAMLNLAIAALELGTFEEAVALAREARARAEAAANQMQLAYALVLEATAAGYLGRYAGARELIEQALAIALALQNSYLESLIAQYQVEMFLVLGHLGEAKTAAKTVLALSEETGNAEQGGRLGAFLGEIVGRQGDLGGAKEYLARAVAAARAVNAKGTLVRALKVQAWIALREGEWSDARALTEEAIALAHAVGARYQIAELEGFRGEIAMATQQGDALLHFQAMEVLAREMRCDLLLAQALFGQAAARVNPVQSSLLTRQAQALLQGLMADLDEDSRLCFQSLRERLRILDGDFINGFKPGPVASAKVSLPGIRLGQGWMPGM